MSPHLTAWTARRSTLLAALLIGLAGCRDLPTATSPTTPTAPALKLADAPDGSIPGPLDVTPQPPPPSIP